MAEHCVYYTRHYAAAKSLQSCPSLCDPIDGSSPGSPIPGILQARTLEWVAISFSGRLWQCAHPRPLSLLQRGLAPRSNGKARAELRPARRQARGRLMGFLRLQRPWGFSPEARRGSQGASRAAPGKSGLHARGEGERVLELCLREALAVCTPPAPEPSAKRPGS